MLVPRWSPCPPTVHFMVQVHSLVRWEIISILFSQKTTKTKDTGSITQSLFLLRTVDSGAEDLSGLGRAGASSRILGNNCNFSSPFLKDPEKQVQANMPTWLSPPSPGPAGAPDSLPGEKVRKVYHSGLFSELLQALHKYQ